MATTQQPSNPPSNPIFRDVPKSMLDFRGWFNCVSDLRNYLQGTVIDRDTPGIVTRFRLETKPAGIQLTWNSIPKAAEYHVSRNVKNDSATATVIAVLPGRANVSFFDVADQVTEPTLYYWIQAFNFANDPGPISPMLSVANPHLQAGTLGVRTVTSDTTLTESDRIVIGDTTSNPITMTLPPAATVASGGETVSYWIRNTGNVNNVIVDGYASETIDGQLTKTVGPHTAIQVVSDGTEWFTVGDKSMTRRLQDFSASGTWTRPANVDVVDVIVQAAGGGGGSGGASLGTDHGGGGGSAGEYIVASVPVSGNVTVTVGAAGVGGAGVTAGTTQGHDGTDGGASSFGSLVITKGGKAGLAGVDSTPSASSAGGAVSGHIFTETNNNQYANGFGVAGAAGGTGGTFNTSSFTWVNHAHSGYTFPGCFDGGNPGADYATGPFSFVSGGGGGGGGSRFGFGGNGSDGQTSNPGATVAATAFGAGGGGSGGAPNGGVSTGPSGAGGNGGGGRVIVTWWE